jgi:Ni/Co efflux regulator RcnB
MEITMNKILSAAIALSLLSGTAYAAQGNDTNRQGQRSRSSQSQQQQWSRGGRLPDQYRQQQYRVNDWQQRRLQPPPNGYAWYRNDDNQYLLAALATGIIAAVVNQNDYQGDVRYQNSGGYQNYPQWSRGDQISNAYRGNQYVVDNWRSYNLRRPARGYEWIQINNQFVLVRTRNGLIIDVVAVDNRYDRYNRYNRNDRDDRRGY